MKRMGPGTVLRFQTETSNGMCYVGEYVRGYARVVEIQIPYQYQIELDRIKNKEDLVNWVFHISGKSWANSGNIVHELIEAVCKIKGWSYREL